MTEEMKDHTLRTVGRNIGNNFSVEHIWAQNPEKLKLSTEEEKRIHADYIHRLGNLTLETGRVNSSMRNAPYEEKVDRYVKSGFLLTRIIPSRYESWGSNQIDTRTEKIIEFAMNRWAIP
jgi:hypothetical protein